MAQTFIALVPDGPAVAVPTSETLKTFIAAGVFDGVIVLEVSSDGVIFNVAAQVDSSNKEPVAVQFSAAFARARIVKPMSGTPIPILGVNTITGSTVGGTIAMPASAGVGRSST